jgi:hypothetical protein
VRNGYSAEHKHVQLPGPHVRHAACYRRGGQFGFVTASTDWWDLAADPRDALVADTAIFVPQRARPSATAAGHSRATGGELGPVENEDYVSSQLRMSCGAGWCWRRAGYPAQRRLIRRRRPSDAEGTYAAYALSV